MRIETERLILRPWEHRDRLPLRAILGDSQVRRFYPAPATAEESDRLIEHSNAEAAVHGFHFQAVEHRSDGVLLGMMGLAPMSQVMQAATGGKVEIGWQLNARYWGQGLAPEGARAWLDHAWHRLDLDEVVAFTAAINRPSRRVMEKIGMDHDPATDFAHPRLPDGHALRPHVLYRLRNPLRR